MGNSKVLKNHVARYPLRSDRSYVAFEMGSIHNDMATFCRQLSKLIVNDWALSSVCKRLADRLENYDSRELYKIQEEARQLAWETMHTSNEDWGCLMLMLTAFLSGGIQIDPRKIEETSKDGDQGVEVQ